MRNPSTAVLHLSACVFSACVFSACIQTQSAAPDLGPCAQEAKDNQTYGQIGIGTCLAGPTDLRFVERNGRTWLAVSNADPFLNFEGGSVLMMDWADITGQLDNEVVLTTDVDAVAVPTEHFIAGMGEIRDRGLLLVTRRLTEGGRTRTGEDSAFVIDLETASLWADGDEVQLKDDPGFVAIQPSTNRAFVLNYTDHSVSVVATDTTPLIPLDLAPEASIEITGLSDSDAVVELARVELLDEASVPDDLWTLTWLPGQVRVWSPSGSGLDRWSSGGGGYQISAQQPVVDASVIGVGAMDDPVVGTVFVDATSSAALHILYADGGAIFDSTNTQGQAADDWQLFPTPLLGTGAEGAFDTFRSGPSLTFPNGIETLFYEGAIAEGEPASIGIAVTDDGVAFTVSSTPVLSMEGMSLEQPFAQVDRRTGQTRMWLTMRDLTTGRHSIGYASAEDGFTFDAPVPIELNDFFFDIGAPVVRYDTGRYRMWTAVRRFQDDTWQHVELESIDGFEWSTTAEIFDAGDRADDESPPRLAVQVEPTAAWRVEGADTGVSTTLAFAGFRYTDFGHGFTFSVTSGHEIEHDRFSNGRAANGVLPNSHVFFRSLDRLYVTVVGDDGRSRLGLLEGFADQWDVVAQDLIPLNTGGNVSGVRSALVFDVNQDESLFAMLYTALDENSLGVLHMATSTDGISFTPLADPLLTDEQLPAFASASLEPRSIRRLDDGGIEVWFGGNDGSRWRIGALVDPAFDPSAPAFELVPATFSEHQLAPGQPSGIDDSGVKDPMVYTTIDAEGLETRKMLYAGNDGTSWHLGVATYDEPSQAWVRRLDEDTDATLPAMSGVSRTFSAGGVDSPVARVRTDGLLEVWYAGTDDDPEQGGIPRLGKARGRDDRIFAQLRQPQLGDTFSFQTQRGDDVVSVIELAQRVEAFESSGIGTTGLILDEERGFLFIPSKLSSQVYVVDIRDDSRVGFTDRNAMDLETRVRFPTLGGTNGFRGGVISPTRDRLYLTMRNPDGIAVVDLDAVVDNGEKEATDTAVIGFLPMQDNVQDAGSNTVASFAGGEPAIAGDLLLVPHYRDNSLSVFDLGLGAYGEEVAYIPHLGENPHLVRVSPDGNWAVVANYLGDIDEEQSSSTLALIDLNPSSATYLTVTNWIKNK